MALGFGHAQAIGRPMFRVAVWVNRPKHLDHAIAAQMNRQAAGGNVQFTDRLLLSRLQADLSVAFQPRQPVPPEVAHQLQVLQAAVPTVERHQRRLKTARFALVSSMARKWSFLLKPSCGLVVQAKIAGQSSIAIRPHQTDEVDPLHHLVLFARPMARHQRHLAGIGLVQRRVVDDQQAFAAARYTAHFRPQRLTIRRQALQQARVGVMRGFVARRRDGCGQLQLR